MEQPLLWVGSSLEDLKAFPADARRIAGYQLFRLQEKMQPADWKPMPSVGTGVEELRIHTKLEHRVIYVARFSEGVYVLHAFEKRGAKTAAKDVQLARVRYREALAGRRRRKHGKDES